MRVGAVHEPGVQSAGSSITIVFMVSNAIAAGCSGVSFDSDDDHVTTKTYSLTHGQLVHWFDWPLGDNHIPGENLSVIQTFGGVERCDGSFQSQAHTGIDLTLSDGTALGREVYAAAEGIVRCLSTTRGGPGAVVGVEHTLENETLYTIYRHLEPTGLPLLGATVHRGQVIGKVGDHPRGPHLHFEVRDWLTPNPDSNDCAGPGYAPVNVAPTAATPPWKDPVAVYHAQREHLVAESRVDHITPIRVSPSPNAEVISIPDQFSTLGTYRTYFDASDPIRPVWFRPLASTPGYIASYSEGPGACTPGPHVQRSGAFLVHETQGSRLDAILELLSAMPASFAVNVRQQVVVRAWNIGDKTWTAGGKFGLGIAGSNPYDGTPPINMFAWSSHPAPCTSGLSSGYYNNTSDGRVYICHDVQPGGFYDFQLSIVPVSSAFSSALLSVRMVNDGNAWFGASQTWSAGVRPAVTGASHGATNTLSISYAAASGGDLFASPSASVNSGAEIDRIVLSRAVGLGSWIDIATFPRGNGEATYTDPAIAPGVRYRYRAQARGATYTSPHSEELSLTAARAPGGFVCPELAWSNACGEPQTGIAGQLACNPYDDRYECIQAPGDEPGAGHWELRWIGDCMQSLAITCPPEPTSFYACPDGTDFCGGPITGTPNQITCGADGSRYQCQPHGWELRSDLGSCTQSCDGGGAFTCEEAPGLCWEPQVGVQQELNCSPYNDVMQCVRAPDDAPGQGHWEVKWLGDCDSITGRHCS